MAFQEQVAKLVERLTALSESDRVEWEETAARDTFQALVSKFVVTVAKTGSYANSDYCFTIVDQAGKVIEEAISSGVSEWQALSRLHELARRHALRVDEALSDLLSSLEGIR